MSREVQVRFCESRAVRSRPATHLVILVFGGRDHARALWGEVEQVLAMVGLRLAVEKTHTTHLDQGFDFLGHRIQRHRQWGSDRRYVYSYPSKKSVANIRRKVKTVTGKQTTNQAADVLFIRLGQITRGWALHFRHGAAKTSFADLHAYLWRRVWIWLRNKHPDRTAKWIKRCYYPHGWWPETNGRELFKPGTVAIERYRYRGHTIPTPWAQQPAPTTA